MAGKYAVGTTHPTNNHGEIEVVEDLGGYPNDGTRRIKFLKSGNTKVTSIGAIRAGELADRPNGPIFGIGTRHKTNSHGDIIIIDAFKDSRRIVEFVDSGHRRTVTTGSISTGCVADKPSGNRYEVGTTHPTKNHGDIVIVANTGPNSRRVRFVKTGNETEVFLTSIDRGFIADKPNGDKYAVGTKHMTRLAGEVEIIAMAGNMHREIMFLDTGNTKRVHLSQLVTRGAADGYTT